MPEHERSDLVRARPQLAYAYVADPRNLASYVATMRAAEPLGAGRVRVAAQVDSRLEEGDARFRADPGRRRIEWGGLGGDGYTGWLEVGDGGAEGLSRVTIHLTTRRQDVGPRAEQALTDTLIRIKELLEGT